MVQKRKLSYLDVRAIITRGLWPSTCPLSVFGKCRKVPHTLGFTITNSQSSSVSCVLCLVSHMYKVTLLVPQSHRSRMSTTVLLLVKDNVSFQKLLFLGNEGASQLHSLFRVHKRRSQMANGQKFKRQTRFVQFCSNKKRNSESICFKCWRVDGFYLCFSWVRLQFVLFEGISAVRVLLTHHSTQC